MTVGMDDMDDVVAMPIRDRTDTDALSEATAERWATLRELMERPELLEEPDEIVPRVAWRGRHTLLAGLAKIGKSTFVGQAAAAVTMARPFLDGKALRGRVVWVGVEEPLGLTVSRFVHFSALPGDLQILVDPSGDLMGELESFLDEWPADLVVIDSLIEWARRTTKEKEPPASGDAAGWAGVVRPLTEIAHDGGPAVVTLHHGKKSDGRFRDSGEIAAGVDVIYDVLPPRGGEEPNVRRFDGVGRWHVGRWRAAFVDGAYKWLGEIDVDAGGVDDRVEKLIPAIREALESAPGKTVASKAVLCQQVAGRREDVLAAIDRMKDQGEVHVEDAGPGKAAAVTLLPGPADVPDGGEE